MNTKAAVLFSVVVAVCTTAISAAMIYSNQQRVPKYAPIQPDLTELCAAFNRWKQMTGDDEPGMSRRCN